MNQNILILLVNSKDLLVLIIELEKEVVCAISCIQLLIKKHFCLPPKLFLYFLFATFKLFLIFYQKQGKLNKIKHLFGYNKKCL